MTAANRIDVHQHIIPPSHARWLTDHGFNSAGIAIPSWSRESALSMMDELHIGAAVLSVSAPGVHLGNDEEARSQAREVNEFTAELVKDRPDRFGFFASLPLPDVDGALAEISACDPLNPDGYILLANAGGRYLGDELFEPVMQELNRRSATILVHPTVLPGMSVPWLPPPIVDFLLDTTRTALHLVMSRSMARHFALKIILSHAGGFIPYAAHRFAHAMGLNPSPLLPPMPPDEILGGLHRFYFDTTLSSSPATMAALLTFTDTSQVMFGSDLPHATFPLADRFTRQLDRSDVAAAQLDAINRGTAVGLFPRFAT
jgi:predicted TIM-barrel fold metal-dependent hydrolase